MRWSLRFVGWRGWDTNSGEWKRASVGPAPASRPRAPPQHLPLLSVPTVPKQGQVSSRIGLFLFDFWSISHLAWAVPFLKPGSDHVCLLLKLFQQLPWPQLQPCKQTPSHCFLASQSCLFQAPGSFTLHTVTFRGGSTCAMRQFLGQGLHLHLGSDNTRSVTTWPPGKPHSNYF